MELNDLVAHFNSLCDTSPLDIETMGVLVEVARASVEAVAAATAAAAVGWLAAVLDPVDPLERLFLQMIQETHGTEEPVTWPLLVAVAVLRNKGTQAVYDIKYATVSSMWSTRTVPHEEPWIKAAAAHNALRVAVGLVPYSDPHIQELLASRSNSRIEAQAVAAFAPSEAAPSEGAPSEGFEPAALEQVRSDGWNVGKPRNPMLWTTVQLTLPGKYYCLPTDVGPTSVVLFSHGFPFRDDSVESTRNGLNMGRTIIVYVTDTFMAVIQERTAIRVERTGTPMIGLFQCGLTITYMPSEI